MFLTAFVLLISSFQAPVEADPVDLAMNEQDFLALNDEIRLFLDTTFENTHGSAQKLDMLINAIFAGKGLALTYGNSRTKTVAETFRERSGNCLSFTTMFVAMARYIGLPAYFQEVETASSWDKKGDVIINNRHMNVVVAVHGRLVEVDFMPYQEKRQHRTRRISDREALAHYFNNKGAEAFANEDRPLARRYFERAVDVEPGLARAWSNLGVYFRTHGEFKKAEECYFRAIELDEQDFTTLSNLAHLYDLTGRERKAASFRKKVENFRQRNPYYHLSQGRLAYDMGDYRESVQHFKKAIRINSKEPEFYHALAQAYCQLGDSKKVEKNLKLAHKWALSEEARHQYHQKLEWLLARN